MILDLLSFPNAMQYVTVRGYIVPPEHHKPFIGSTESGFHAGEAANAGIRRARGRFITPKASDSIYTSDVFKMIARRDLDADTMYRIDRHDVTITNDQIWDLGDNELLAMLQSLPSHPHGWIEQSRHWRLRELHTNACGDFTLMSAAYWHYIRGHVRDRTVLSLDIDSLALHAAAALGVRECRWPDSCRVYKSTHDKVHSERVQQVWRPWQRRLDKFLSEKVSEEAAHWARTRFDYPRRKVRGINTALGPSIEKNFVAPASRWAKGEKPIPTQPENWGLGDVVLESRTLCRAHWDVVSDAA
ncbi:MAG: hypothetical protein JSR24_00730 [Proteobacteria bacterium]|nr:hypothetical protein [Pseudomonadota bacterium]